MAKTPSSKLFNLIKSLSGSEKRHFKLFIRSREKPDDNKYERLFDAIFAQQQFDDGALRRAVYGSSTQKKRKYSELKAYLYSLIIKSLQSYDEKSSVEYDLKNKLLGVRSLFKRSLFEDAKYVLKKAKKTAQQYEDFNTLIEILDWEKKIAYAQTDIAFLDKELGRISEEEKKYLQQLNNISEYKSAFFKILVSLRKDVSRSASQKRELDQYIDTPLFKNEKHATSFKAKVYYLRSLSLYYFSKSDFEAFYQTSKKLVALIEADHKWLEEDVSEYISVLNNHILSCGRTMRIEELESTLDKLKNVKPLTADDELKIHRQYYLGKFRLCINKGEFKEGLKELKKHFKEIEKYDEKQFSKDNFYLQYFCIYFGNEDYKNALRTLNEWLEISGGVERKDLQSLARLLNLIIHYELGNTILLDSLLRSTYRFLNKENKWSELEKKLLNFIKEVSTPQSKKQKKQALEKLKSEFEGLSELPNYGIFGLFDIVSWLESKISGRPFAQVVKSKFRKSIHSA
ncbi:MAG TPA: hypothetical protein ENJ53_01615 [Phaeodactylibacter sp.]|nr:hypothetical protein [Phaeodactylibacter sp.]